ncbi:hypothetical protein SNOG_02197 [Parastagonospora nodorum SN15]|uniref:Uncharacterized protein n=1 Tax=Phaeosphaeria nodorum (strain SN15 / ATCC MYA-4574 / FGSC 10173) TaxID=321614 RepID=Q0V1B7_PHANO|nr:hypothetical protein SNOG_02197 [Parastagonospora nodorum SN15]EAT90409.1 hypothetical protein SNOG_02197 [Parastagonospora nodorum SN15]
MHPITRSYESAKNVMISCTLDVAGQRMCCEVSVVEQWCDNAQKIFHKWYIVEGQSGPSQGVLEAKHRMYASS